MQEQMYFPEGGVGSFLTLTWMKCLDNVLAFGQPRGINYGRRSKPHGSDGS